MFKKKFGGKIRTSQPQHDMASDFGSNGNDKKTWSDQNLTLQQGFGIGHETFGLTHP